MTDKLTSEEIEALPLCEKIYTQILGNGSFLFYHDGYGYTFANKGEEATSHCLRNYLERITYLYGPSGYYNKYANENLNGSDRPWERSGDVYTISDITVDENGYFYIRLCITKKEVNIRGGIDLSKMPDPENDMTQIYCRVFSIDVGEDFAVENSQVSDETANYFVSENQNYQNAVNEWMSVDGQVISFGEGKPSEKQIAERVGTAEALKNKYKDTFGVFVFNKSSFPVHLYVGRTKTEKNEVKAYGIPLDPELLRLYIQQGDKHTGALKSLNTFFVGFYSGQQESTGKANTIGQMGTNAFAFENNVMPAMPTVVQDEVERTFTVEYTETETDDEGNEVSRTRTEERTETAFFVKEVRTSFPKATNVLFSKETVNDCSLAPSSREGVVEYTQNQYDIRNGKLNVTETEILWKAKASQFSWSDDLIKILRNLVATVIPDRAKKILMLESDTQKTSSPLLLMTGENGIYYGNPSAMMGSVTMRGIPYEEMTTSTESLGSDFYYDPVRAAYMIKNQKEWLYLASPAEGILKINLGLGDAKNSLSTTAEKAGRVSKIYPYPCFGIHTDESGNAFRVIAFQTDEYSYDDIDQFRAKVYQVPLDDAQAQLNQMSFVFDLNDRLQRQFMNEVFDNKDLSAAGSVFSRTLRNMGIQDVSADHVKSYLAYLRDIVNRKIEARRQIGTITGIMNLETENAFPRYAFEQYNTILKELKTDQDVEKFFLLIGVAKNTFEGVAKNQQELVQDLKAQVARSASSQSGGSAVSQISKIIWPDFTNKNFEETYSRFKTLQNSSMRLRDIDFSGMNCTDEQEQNMKKGKETQTYYWIYLNLSKNREEVEKIAAYISADQDIQKRILEDDQKVWDEIYTDCGLSRDEIENRVKTENPKLVSVIDYEAAIRERAKEWRSARALLLTLQGMNDGEAEKRTFFSRLLSKDLAMQEKECKSGTMVESLILSLCRDWPSSDEISGKSDYDLVKFLQERNGYTERTWKREMDELAEDLSLDCSLTGYSNRGNYAVRKMADQMEDNVYDAKEHPSAIKNPGQLILESMKESGDQTPWTSKEWQFQLVNAGIPANSTEPRLSEYSLYLKKEVQDRENVKTELETLAGVKVPENRNIEEQYDSCNTVDDIETLLAGLYVERPEMKQYYTGGKESQGEPQAQKSQETKTALTIDDMVKKMRTQSGLTEDQWTKKMETLLAQMEIKVSASDFFEYEENLNEKKNLQLMLERRQKRAQAIKDYNLITKAYPLAYSLYNRDLSYQAFEKEVEIDETSKMLRIEPEIDALGKLVLENEYIWDYLLMNGPMAQDFWKSSYREVGDQRNADYIRIGMSVFPPALKDYQTFCARKVAEWSKEKKKLFEILEVSEADIKDKDAFYEQVMKKALERREKQ
ncbi:hypothetical protein [Brotaphodocola sp.]|uniref:hypothetical protein n=1 Tax=Brotaphodocola sp. TaxID=3073577 RepID=UPI003D7DB4FE